jgi:hypothetical protein
MTAAYIGGPLRQALFNQDRVPVQKIILRLIGVVIDGDTDFAASGETEDGSIE